MLTRTRGSRTRTSIPRGHSQTPTGSLSAVPDFSGGRIVQLSEHPPRCGCGGCGGGDVRRRCHRRWNVETVVLGAGRRSGSRGQRRRTVGELDGDRLDGAGRYGAVEVFDRLLGLHARVVTNKADAFRQT